MDRNEIPEQWQRVRIDVEGIETPLSKYHAGSFDIVEQTHALDGFEDLDGIQVIQKQHRKQSAERIERGDEPLIETWIDIVDSKGDEREILFTSIFLETHSLDADSRKHMELVNGVRERSLSSAN